MMYGGCEFCGELVYRLNPLPVVRCDVCKRITHWGFPWTHQGGQATVKAFSETEELLEDFRSGCISLQELRDRVSGQYQHRAAWLRKR